MAQTTERQYKLEEYEWDNTWIECTNKTDGKRVLYIGDSISVHTRLLVTKLSENRYYTDGYATSKALDNPQFKPMLSLFARDEAYRDAILFNNGLHGWQLSEEEYGKQYGQFLDYLTAEFPHTPVFVVLTTDVTEAYNSDGKARVRARNEAAIREAEKRGMTVIDAYRVSVEYENLHTTEGVHFVPEGYEKIAGEIIRVLDEKLK